MLSDTLPQEAVAITRQLAQKLRAAVEADEQAGSSEHTQAFFEQMEQEARKRLGDQEVDQRLATARNRAHTLIEMVCEGRLDAHDDDR